MCGNNQNEPLGCPAGSVRAVLAFIVVTPIIFSAISLMILMFIQSQYTSALGILSGLTGMAGTIVGYYFGVNSANKVTSELTKSLQSKDQQINLQHQQITRSILLPNQIN